MHNQTSLELISFGMYRPLDVRHRASRFGYAALMLFALFATAASAEDTSKLGPQVGQAFAYPLEAQDQSGSKRTLRSLMGKNGLVLLFIRSPDWCPYCRAQVMDVNKRLPDFRVLGLNVATVSVDEVATLAEFAASQHIVYTMLSDPKGAINLALGIRDPQYPVGSAAFGVPRPTLYVMDRAGIIRLRYMEPTFRTRPDLDKVLADAKGMAGTGK